MSYVPGYGSFDVSFLHGPVFFFCQMSVAEVFDYLIDAVKSSPEYKGPVRTVPKPREEKGNHQVKGISLFGASVAAERDVYIVTKPGGKRNVPPAPEFLHAP